jgi:hypothetical protein
MVFAIETDKESQTHFDSDGLWGACDPCHNFIQAGDWDGLAERSVDNMIRIYKMPPSPAERMLGALMVKNAHGHFRAGWDGKPPTAEKTDEEILADLLGDQ